MKAVISSSGAAAASQLSHAEAELLAAYRTTSGDGQIDMLLAVKALARVSPRHRPPLTLVPVDPRGGAR